MLELAIDKFTFRVPTDRLYSVDGLWVKAVEEAGKSRVRVGVSDYLQQHSGDVAFATVRPIGTALAAGDDLAEMETVKVNIALPAPVTGQVVEVNASLDLEPERINQTPYEAGWLAVLELANPEEGRRGLIEAAEHLAQIKQMVEAELGQP